MNLHKMIEICLKDDNMHRIVMINALICINNQVITCINSMLSVSAPCAPPGPRVGHPRPSHVASMPSRIRAVVLRTTSAPAVSKPLFCDLNKEILKKIKLESDKKSEERA